MRNTLPFLVLAFLVLPAAPAHSQKAKAEAWAELLPPGDGRELVLDSCASCHNLKIVVHARLSRADWAKSVNDMIQRGAPVFPEEIEPIATYLSKAFGTTVPKLVNVNTASREDLQKLPHLKLDIVTRILEVRSKAGHFNNAEELRQALGMEKGDFERILYEFKYSD